MSGPVGTGRDEQVDEGVSGTFIRPCLDCGRTVYVVASVEQSHDCEPPDDARHGRAVAWWAGYEAAREPRQPRPVMPLPAHDDLPTLAWMQRTQPWTAPYSRAFVASKNGQGRVDAEPHRSLMHDLMHVTKAVGILASIAEWADHGSVRTGRVDQAEYEGRIADLVMCALHMANNPPEGYETFDLQRAVIERVERVNGVAWVARGESS